MSPAGEIKNSDELITVKSNLYMDSELSAKRDFAEFKSFPCF